MPHVGSSLMGKTDTKRIVVALPGCLHSKGFTFGAQRWGVGFRRKTHEIRRHPDSRSRSQGLVCALK